MKLKLAAISAALFIGLAAPAQAAGPSPAASMLGVTLFVTKNCPTMHPNWPMLKQALEAQGIDFDNPDRAVMMEASVWYSSIDMSRSREFCREIRSKFGKNGTATPDVYIDN